MSNVDNMEEEEGEEERASNATQVSWFSAAVGVA